jgi:hypothetical protein
MGVMSVSAPGAVKQAIGDLLIKLKGDAHQIKYKPTQRKNSKAEKMFPGVLTGLCGKGIMRSIRHGLKSCEKTLCNAKKFTIKANMDWYQLPLPVVNGYFKQVTPPKAISNSESGEYLLNKLIEFKKNGCNFLSLNMTPSTTAAWHPCGTSSSIWEKSAVALGVVVHEPISKLTSATEVMVHIFSGNVELVMICWIVYFRK